MQIKLACILVFAIFFDIQAQKDTVYLQEIEIIMPRFLKYTNGGNITLLEKKISNQNLNELISENTAVYFKNYGNGQLSTITLRGTTAAHTSVIWNGISVNSPTLGQTDFSLWPTYLLDNVAIHFGGSSAAFGSGAIGGAILLNKKEPVFNKGKSGNLNLEVGSFGNYTTAGTFKISGKNIINQIKIYRNSIKNNFEIQSKNRNQNNASILRYGFDQQLEFKIKPNKILSFEGFYVFNHRQIQPYECDNSSQDELQNKNLRLSLNYNHKSEKGIWDTNLGYIIYDQQYNISSKIKTNQATITSTYDLPLGQSANLKTGILYVNFRIDTDAYIRQINENRLDIFSAINFSLKDWWHISFNLRKGFYMDKSFPFVPSIGQETDIIKNKISRLKFKILISRSFRIPTLNDRFWGTQGNPNLLSENGNNAEAGLIYHSKINLSKLTVSLIHYRSWINNLIVWLPTVENIFKPQNQQKVNTAGFELSVKWSTPAFGGKLHSVLNYSYTKSTNKKGLNNFDQTGVNKQLPYVPFNSGNLSIQFEKNGWKISSFLEYTGKRFTTLDNTNFNSVNAYKLLNLSITKAVLINSIEVTPYFKINNILNNDYNNFKNYAMPGRNFLLGINVNFIDFK